MAGIIQIVTEVEPLSKTLIDITKNGMWWFVEYEIYIWIQ